MALRKTSKTDEVNETYWFPTPQNLRNKKEHAPNQTRIFNELRELEKLEQLNQQEKELSSPTIFQLQLDRFHSRTKQAVEALLVEFQKNLARHRFDIGINTDFKVQLTPLDEKPAYSQNLLEPIIIKDDILVELSLLPKYGIIISLPFSKYANP